MGGELVVGLSQMVWRDVEAHGDQEVTNRVKDLCIEYVLLRQELGLKPEAEWSDVKAKLRSLRYKPFEFAEVDRG